MLNIQLRILYTFCLLSCSPHPHPFTLQAESGESGDPAGQKAEKQQASSAEGQEPTTEASVKAIEEFQQKLKDAEVWKSF